LKSEAEFRDFRYRALRAWRKRLNCQAVVLAHHRDDLLETRLLRLIRGSGPFGLRAMSRRTGDLWRPLLDVSRAEIEEYAREIRLPWLEDPTNADENLALRNWLRRDWLPRLESRRQGAAKALARSLELLSEAKRTHFETQDFGPFVGLRREGIASLPRPRQRSIVARYLRGLGLQGYGQSHVNEILKRLSTRRREFEFEMLGLKFHVRSDVVWASRV
jgi:tRNA(Ile)-lysidine synthase